MNFCYSIDIGDTSNDGHGRADTYIFNCTHTIEDIREAYIAAVKKSGIALHNPWKRIKGVKVVLSEYEEGYIEDEDFQKLLALGVDYEKTTDIEPCNNAHTKWSVMPKGVAQLFLEMAKTQIEGFEYEFIKTQSVNLTQGGYMGYGCYYR